MYRPAPAHLRHPLRLVQDSQRRRQRAAPPHAARVSAVTKYPELEPAVVAALQDLDEELVDDQSGGYVPKRPRVIINLQCNSVTLRALTDPGLEINLISDWVVDRH